jgi:hypothetical protein
VRARCVHWRSEAEYEHGWRSDVRIIVCNIIPPCSHYLYAAVYAYVFEVRRTEAQSAWFLVQCWPRRVYFSYLLTPVVVQFRLEAQVILEHVYLRVVLLLLNEEHVFLPEDTGLYSMLPRCKSHMRDTAGSLQW